MANGLTTLGHVGAGELRTAAATVIAYAEAGHPDFLRVINVIYAGKPGRNVLEKTACMLVRRALYCGPAPPRNATERLEREWRELMGTTVEPLTKETF